MPTRSFLRFLCCSALALVVASTSGASGDVFELSVEDTRVALPLPKGLKRASIHDPAAIQRMRKVHGLTNGVVELLFDPECTINTAERQCPAAFELVLVPDRISDQEWPSVRAAMLADIRGNDRLLQREETAQAEKRVEAEMPGLRMFTDKTAAMVLMHEDDPRSVRARLQRPMLITQGEARFEIVQIHIQLQVRGRYMGVYAMHLYPYGQVDEDAVERLDAEADAFLTDLYALNPTKRAR